MLKNALNDTVNWHTKKWSNFTKFRIFVWMIINSNCEGCDIVQSDHAPQAGVAQGIFHGDLIRRRDGHQVELEEELEEEVERRVRRDHSRDKTQVRMHG